MTYTQLGIDVEAQLERDDISSDPNRWALITRAAEPELRRDLRLVAGEKISTFLVSSRYTPLPDDYLQMKAVSDIEYKTVDDIRGTPEFDRTGDPCFYAIEGNSLVVAPTPAAEVSIRITYFRDMYADATNYPEIEKNYDMVLWQFCKQAMINAQEAEMAIYYNGLYDAARTKSAKRDKMERWGTSADNFPPCYY